MKQSIQKGERNRAPNGARKHFTASVWILSSGKPKKMLLVHHKKYNLWLQPGGHVEEFENPIETAVREVKEETGLDIGFLFDEIKTIDHDGSLIPSPDFIIEEAIPAHGEEPKHYHTDLMYVVNVDEQELKPNKHESQEAGWFTKEEILDLPTHKDTKVIVEKLM